MSILLLPSSQGQAEIGTSSIQNVYAFFKSHFQPNLNNTIQYNTIDSDLPKTSTSERANCKELSLLTMNDNDYDFHYV